MVRACAVSDRSPALPLPSGDCGPRPGQRLLASVVQPWERHLTPETHCCRSQVGRGLAPLARVLVSK